MARHKIGDVVKVYEDPVTHEKLEGEAELFRHIPELDDPELGERWAVLFTGDDDLVQRWI